MTKTTKITRTEANDVIARHVVLTALRTNTTVTITTIEEQVEAFANSPSALGRSTYFRQWAKLCNPRSAYRLAVKNLREQGREDLIVQQPTTAQRGFLGIVALAGGKDVYFTKRRNPSSAIVIACRNRGWIVPYEGPLQVDGQVSWAPWTITDAGRDAAYGLGDYRS